MIITNNEEYVDKILVWAKEREIDKQPPAVSFSKVIEEIGETIDATVQKENPEDNLTEIEDSLGDVVVTLINFFHNSHLFSDEEIKQSISNKTLEVRVNRMKIYGGTQYDANLICNLVNDLGSIYADFLRNEKHFWLLNDTFFQVEMLCQNYKLTLNKCLEHSYNEIKHRKGKTQHNTFVKEADLKK